MKLQDTDKRFVYVVGVDGARNTGDIEICESFQELNDYLCTLNTVIETDILVLHGVITSAKYIPAEIGKHVYIIVQDPEDKACGCIYETDYPDSDDLVALITGLVKAGDDHYKMVDIDDIFVLYGYELNTGYVVDAEELDEEVYEECKAVAKRVKEVLPDGCVKQTTHIDDTDGMSVLYGQVVGKCE